jgi:hypothetical protein
MVEFLLKGADVPVVLDGIDTINRGRETPAQAKIFSTTLP